jgi:hypothetical protein
MFPALAVLDGRPFGEVLVAIAILVVMVFLLVPTAVCWGELQEHLTARRYRRYRAVWNLSLLIGWVACCFGVGFMIVAITEDYYAFSILSMFWS